MKTDWYKDVNPNLDRLAQILGMAGGKKPSHGYTIAEKAPEVVTAPGVYFPAEKGEVIPLESRQEGGTVSPSLSKDNDRAKLEMLHSILSSVKPSNLESRELGGSVIPPHGELEKLKIEQSKYDILKSAISVLKPQGQQKSASKERTSETGEKGIPLESRQMGGSTSPGFRSPENLWEKKQMEGWGPGASRIVGGNRVQWQEGMTTPFAAKTPELPGIPKPPTEQSYGIQPEATKLGVADKGISEGDLLWQKKREEGMAAGQWSMPMFSRDKGGLVTPETEEEKRRRLLGEPMAIPPQPVPAPPPTEQIPAGLQGFITDIRKTPTGTVYTGPEGQANVGPERFFLGDKEVPTGTPGAISGDILAKEREFADIKKQEAERELTLKGMGFGRDLGYWAAHPEEKAQYDFEEMLSRGRYTPAQRAELTKQYIASKGALDVAGLKPGKETTPHLVQNEKGEYVWATPGGVLPAGIMGKPTEPKAPTLQYENKNIEGVPHKRQIGWNPTTGQWTPRGDWIRTEKPEKPERTELTPGEKYEKGLKAIKDIFFQLDPIGNITRYTEGKSEKQYLDTIRRYEQNIKKGMPPMEATNDAITKGAPEKLIELPKPPVSPPKKEGRYNWEGHEWNWTKKGGWRLVK